MHYNPKIKPGLQIFQTLTQVKQVDKECYFKSNENQSALTVDF